jgi:RNA polymerase sigma-70 factor (ECF subfamily)
MSVKVTEQANDIPREILLSWKNGDLRAFERIVKSTMKRAYHIALGLVGNIEDARDLSQESYMAAHHSRKSFDVERPFFPWFYKILRNRCLNFIEKRARRREISLDVLVQRRAPGSSPDNLAIRKERIEAVWKALFSLSPQHREIIILRSFRELSYREISDLLGISEGTVMSRLFYARRALYKSLRMAVGELFEQMG